MINDPNLRKNWDSIKQRLKKDLALSEIAYTTWIDPLRICGIEDNHVVIGCNNLENQDIQFIRTRYLNYLTVSVSELVGETVHIEFMNEENAQNYKNKLKQNIETKQEESGLNPKYTLKNFVCGESNKYAYNAAQQVAEDGESLFNPLYIYGNSGVGRTHLLQAIGNYILEQEPETRVLYTQTDRIVDEVVDTIRGGKGWKEFDDKYQDLDVLLVDGVDQIAGKEQSSEWFYKIARRLYEDGKQVIATGGKRPDLLETLDNRLLCFFQKGLIIGIDEPDEEVKQMVLLQLAEKYNLVLDEKNAKQIAEKGWDSIWNVEGKLRSIINTSLTDKKDSSDLIMEWIEEIGNKQVKETASTGGGIECPRITLKKQKGYSVSIQD